MELKIFGHHIIVLTFFYFFCKASNGASNALEGGGFLQVQAMVSFMSLCLLVVHSCIKIAPAMH
jgi:hypothetical protein